MISDQEDQDDQDDLIRELATLRQDHRDLDDSITALLESGRNNNLQIQRLKKKKLCLKDRIIALEDKLIPDISA